MENPVPKVNRTVGTQEDRESREWKDRCKREAVAGRKSPSSEVRREADRNEVGKLLNSDCREKPLLFYLRPYRKPTQVDEERIQRPTGEALLRN